MFLSIVKGAKAQQSFPIVIFHQGSDLAILSSSKQHQGVFQSPVRDRCVPHHISLWKITERYWLDHVDYWKLWSVWERRQGENILNEAVTRSHETRLAKRRFFSASLFALATFTFGRWLRPSDFVTRASTCSAVSPSIASHIGITVAKLVRELTHESQLQRAMTENAGLRAKFERLRKELDFTSNYELVRKSRILQISSEISTRGYSFGSSTTNWASKTKRQKLEIAVARQSAAMGKIA